MNRADILTAARKCVCGQREQDYGKPEDNFKTIAEFWSTYKDVNFTAEDVAVMMALLKIARIKTGSGTEDCFVDLAGYAACGGEMAKKKVEKPHLRITFNNRDLLHDVVRELNVLIKNYGRASVNDLFDISGVPSHSTADFRDSTRGWNTPIDTIYEDIGNGNYVLLLPLPIKFVCDDCQQTDTKEETNND